MLFKGAYSSAMSPGLRGRTVDDLIREVRRDTSLNPSAKKQAIDTVVAASRNQGSTPISAFAAGGAGAVIANLAGKYFGMSPVGRAMVTAVGFGIGQQINTRLGTARNNHGWDLGVSV